MKRVVAVVLFVMGCADAPLGLSAECSRTSQCDQPLVCRLQACRTECASTRDCPVGSVCLADDSGFGSCRLPREASCGGDADCPTGTACVAAQCVNSCSDSADCTPGTSCVDGGCRVVDLPCVEDRDCVEGVCLGGVCADECRSDRDCRFGATCGLGRCIGGDGGLPDARMDVSDAGAIPTLENANAVAVGTEYSCAIADGNVHCWGRIPPQALPEERAVCAPLFAGADAIKAAPDHYCALSGTTLRCAGSNGSGRLGDGTTTDSAEPVDVALADVSVFSVGGGGVGAGALAHTCAISAGEVHCWGGNFSHQLGDGTTTGSPTPVATGVMDAVDVATGYGGTCAVTAAGELWCWGAGVPLAPVTGTPTPTSIALPARVTQVEMATTVSTIEGCVIDDMARVYCWTMGGSPIAVMGVSARRLAVGGRGEGFACAVQTDASVMCWGWNRNGECGSGSVEDMIAVGTHVRDTSGNLSGAVDIAAGAQHACAVVGTEVYCWGQNQFGQLGSNGRTPSNVARRVTCVP